MGPVDRTRVPLAVDSRVHVAAGSCSKDECGGSLTTNKRAQPCISRSGAVIARELLSCSPSAVPSLLEGSFTSGGEQAQQHEVGVRTDWDSQDGVVTLNPISLSSWLSEARFALKSLMHASEAILDLIS